MIDYAYYQTPKVMLLDLFDIILGGLNSPFNLTLIGAFAAAFAGAYGAQKAIEKSKKKDDLLKEFRITNAAIMVCHDMANAFISVKKQIILDRCSIFQKQNQDLDAFLEKQGLGQLPEKSIFHFEADFQKINPIITPKDVLMKMIFEDTFPGPKAYALTNTLIRTVDTLNLSISTRNDLIDHFKSNKDQIKNSFLFLYFGRTDYDGHTDTLYSDSIDAICSSTDDCIAFSSMLADELVKNAKKLRNTIGNSKDPIHAPNFSEAEKSGLMPDPKNYPDWEKVFQENGADGRT